jgi:hypothetical protein
MKRPVSRSFDELKTLKDNQCGCITLYSASDAARLALHRSAMATAKKRPFAGIFLKVEKAYDKVNHDVILVKLRHFGVPAETHHGMHS